MAPSSPVCSFIFIHASMAGSRSTAPLNRSKSVFVVVPRGLKPKSEQTTYRSGEPLRHPKADVGWELDAGTARSNQHQNPMRSMYVESYPNVAQNVARMGASAVRVTIRETKVQPCNKSFTLCSSARNKSVTIANYYRCSYLHHTPMSFHPNISWPISAVECRKF